jgi:Fe-S-cluster containining protein
MKSESFENPPLAQCRQCGTCCRKGGPALHGEDRFLVENGRLPLSALETLRQGQLVRDNVSNELIILDSDIIKIKGAGGISACTFLSSANRCEIYDSRPRECRLLQCWNTGPLTQAYSRNRLTRQELIGKIGYLWDLVQTHQIRCDYARIYHLIRSFRSSAIPANVPPELGEILSYDIHIRELITQTSPQLRSQMPFLLGQPLTTSLIPQGLQITSTDGGWRIRDIGSTDPVSG